MTWKLEGTNVDEAFRVDMFDHGARRCYQPATSHGHHDCIRKRNFIHNLQSYCAITRQNMRMVATVKKYQIRLRNFFFLIIPFVMNE